MSKEVVLDLETSNSPDDIGGWYHDQLRISVLGAYFYETDTYEHFMEEDLPKLWPRLERADRIIGYNTKGFDNLVINNYYPGDIGELQHLDVLEEIYKSLGYRVKLDAVAKATLGTGKIGHGTQAIEYWKEGKIQELIDYCLVDVKVTKEVYDHAVKYGFVKFEDRMGREVEIPLTIEPPKVEAAPAINLSMPI